MSGINLSPLTRDLGRIVWAIRQILEGRSNSVGNVTLRTGQTTTTVTFANCGSDSRVFLTPQTANAAAILAQVYVKAADISRGSFIITHPSSANTDLTFGFDCRG